MFNKQIDIYNDIFLNILSQKYSPNTLLKERDLALKYRTSRTTIRAILQKLSYENKIIINPRSKTFVKKINLERIQQSFLLRQCLELTVASMILKKIQNQDLQYLSKNIQNQKKLLVKYNKNKNHKYIYLDNQFHSYLFKICGLGNFWKIITEYNFDFDRLRHLAVSDKLRAIQSTNEHVKIFLAIKEKKIKNLKTAIKKHFSNSDKHYKQLIKSNSLLIE